MRAETRRLVADAEARGAKVRRIRYDLRVRCVVEAIEAGMDVASGLHQRLGDFPEIAAAAERHGAKLFDVRHPSTSFKTGTGVKRRGKRLLTVGTDCSCGKKYTALAIERELVKRGVRATFRGTGQTGVMIAGSGVALDAVVVSTNVPSNTRNFFRVSSSLLP